VKILSVKYMTLVCCWKQGTARVGSAIALLRAGVNFVKKMKNVPLIYGI
jgi:hypothetical protein